MRDRIVSNLKDRLLLQIVLILINSLNAPVIDTFSKDWHNFLFNFCYLIFFSCFYSLFLDNDFLTKSIWLPWLNMAKSYVSSSTILLTYLLSNLYPILLVGGSYPILSWHVVHAIKFIHRTHNHFMTCTG